MEEGGEGHQFGWGWDRQREFEVAMEEGHRRAIGGMEERARRKIREEATDEKLEWEDWNYWRRAIAELEEEDRVERQRRRERAGLREGEPPLHKVLREMDWEDREENDGVWDEDPRDPW